jgi:hypothetical protein
MLTKAMGIPEKMNKGTNQFFKMLWLVPLIGIFLTGVTPSIAASEPIEMLVSKDWGAYRYNDNGVRVCFISSAPKKSAGKYDPANRGETRIFVSHGPGKAEHNVVQVIAGYNYKKQSDVTVKIDKRKFTLFTIEDRAYAESEEDDDAMITAMKRGTKMSIVGTSSRGTVTTDSYSLAGFTKTKSIIDKTCK